MNDSSSNGTWVILTSFLAAMIFSVMPLPRLIEWGRPEWVAIVLIYWVIALPHRVGVSTAWVLGVFYDALTGAVLGQHALALSVIAYFSFMLHLRVRVFPIWQQCLTIFVLIGVYQVIVRVVQGMVGAVPETVLFWLPSLISALFWPWVMVLLRHFRRQFQVS